MSNQSVRSNEVVQSDLGLRCLHVPLCILTILTHIIHTLYTYTSAKIGCQYNIEIQSKCLRFCLLQFLSNNMKAFIKNL